LIFGPAPVNLSDTVGHYMWALGEIGNLRNHVETVELSLDIASNPGCDEDIQTILPGHNPFTHGVGAEVGAGPRALRVP